MTANGAEQYDNVATAKSIADAFWMRAASTPDAPLYRWATASSAEATRVWHTETYASLPEISWRWRRNDRRYYVADPSRMDAR